MQFWKQLFRRSSEAPSPFALLKEEARNAAEDLQLRSAEGLQAESLLQAAQMRSTQIQELAARTSLENREMLADEAQEQYEPILRMLKIFKN